VVGGGWFCRGFLSGFLCWVGGCDWVGLLGRRGFGVGGFFGFFVVVWGFLGIFGGVLGVGWVLVCELGGFWCFGVWGGEVLGVGGGCG